jgi:hypothetical protein
MKEICLTQGKVAIVDDEDYEWLTRYKWYVAVRKGNPDYAIRHIWRNGKRTTTTMHQEILKPPIGMVCDHINRNGLDNRRCNIRICTQGNNCMNQNAERPRSTSCYKGVSLRSDGKTWRSRLKTKNKIYNIGTFNSEIDAAMAYNEVAKKMFGEFARLNNIEVR